MSHPDRRVSPFEGLGAGRQHWTATRDDPDAT